MIPVFKNNLWCGTHIYYDDHGNEIKKFPYIHPYIKNTGIGSNDLWCGTHTYFDDNCNEIIKHSYINPYIKNTGIGSVKLWCGKHTKFNEKQNYEIVYKEKKIFDLETNETITEIYSDKIFIID